MSTNDDEDLWGELPDPASLEIPEDVLEQQVQLLTRKTMGNLVGEVRRIESSRYQSGHVDANEAWLTWALEVRVPRIDNFRLRILEVTHDLMMIYPVYVNTKMGRDYSSDIECTDRDTFREALKAIFRHQETQTALRSLMAHAMDPRRRVEARLEERQRAEQGPDDDIPF